MKLRNIKEKLDFMEIYDIDSMKFMEGPFCEEREFELCYFIDGLEESLTLLQGENILIQAGDRSYFEQKLKEFDYKW